MAALYRVLVPMDLQLQDGALVIVASETDDTAPWRFNYATHLLTVGFFSNPSSF